MQCSSKLQHIHKYTLKILKHGRNKYDGYAISSATRYVSKFYCSKSNEMLHYYVFENIKYFKLPIQLIIILGRVPFCQIFLSLWCKWTELGAKLVKHYGQNNFTTI